MSDSPLDKYDCEVIYRGELIGITNTAGRHELLHRAIREGRIALPFRTYDLEFRWVIKKSIT